MKLCRVALLSVIWAADAEKLQVFPSLRKHLLQQQQKLQQQAHQQDDDDNTDSPVVEVTTPAAAVEIPAPVNLGPDGFPQLPGVNTMLNNASETMKSITSQAAILEAKLKQTQMDDQAKMAKKKTLYEGKLKAQESSNRDVEAANNKISEEIDSLKEENTKLRKTAKSLQEGNHLMRSELRMLDSKFDELKTFVSSSMSTTDDTEAKDLKVLKAHAHHAHHSLLGVGKRGGKKRDDDDDGDDEDDKEDGKEDDDSDEGDDEEDDKPTSLLALSSRKAMVSDMMEMDMEEPDSETSEQQPQPAIEIPTGDAKGLVDVLKNGVAELEKQDGESEHKLHAMFVSSFHAGAARHLALLAKQKNLETSRASLQSLQGQLRTAVQHLQGTKAELEQRLRGMGLFMQRLAHLALAPAAEVPRLIEQLPAAVKPAALPKF